LAVGYAGKPFKLTLHNDSAVWGAASNEIVKMVYDEQVWAETPLVNSASTDPTIPETGIPWYFTDLQDNRARDIRSRDISTQNWG
jgi:branched-chain amino acid transport system substrate-binding protein